jgi:hypothetical protein
LNKLSRVYVANTGYRLAWYDGLLLEFTDQATDQPTHTIFNLVNQGGKTTFLSLLFSCIRTSKADFLQTRSTPGQHFEDYFDKGGLPGIIALEWQLPGDLVQPTRTVVTGQLVVLQRGSEPIQSERWFFLIQEKDKLSIEDIPGPNLRGGQAGALKSRDDVQTWLHQRRAALGEQVFYFTQNQGEWARSLEAVGIDVELLSRQVEFNQKEGGMDDAFLSFRDEREFVRRFLTLTMDAERANAVAQLVSSQCEKFAKRQPLLDAQAQMTELTGVFMPFAAAARSYRDAGAEHRLALRQIATAAATLLARAEEKGILKKAKEGEDIALNGQAMASDLVMRAAAKSIEALTLEQHYRSEKSAEVAVKDGAAAVGRTETELRLLNAAELRSEIRLLTRTDQELAEAIDRASGEVAPIRNIYRRKAALLLEGLTRARSTALRQSQEARALEKQANEDIKQLGQRAARYSQQREQAQVARVAAETNLAREVQERQSLVQAQLLLEGEIGDAAVARHAQHLTELRATQEQLEGDAAAASARAAEHLNKKPALAAQQTEATVEARRCDEKLTAGLTIQEQLRQSEVMCRALGAEVADPDSEVLLSLVEAHILRLQEELSQAELDHGRLDEDARSIRETQLAGRDPEVTRVVRALASASVKGVQAFPVYLAQVLPDEDQARRVLESDPARFQGVAVATADQLDVVQKHLAQLPQVSRPVVVSVAIDRPATFAVDGRVVLGPADASQFNYAAAQRKGAHLESMLESSTQRRNTARSTVSTAQQEQRKLLTYLADHGAARLAALASAKEQSLAHAKELAVELAGLDNLAREENGRAADAQRQAKDLNESIRLADRAHSRLQGYVAQYERHVALWTRTVAECHEEERLLSGQLVDIETNKAALEETTRAQYLLAEKQAGTAQDLYTEMATVLDADKAFDAAADLEETPRNLTELRMDFNMALEALRAKELEQTAPLQARRTVTQERLKQVNTQYMAVGADLPLDEVEALLGRDFAVERTRVEAAMKELRKELAVWTEAYTEAKTRHTDFKKRRASPTYEEADAEKLTDAALAERLADCVAKELASRENAAEARRKAAVAKDAARAFGTDAERFANAAKPLQLEVPDLADVAPDPVRYNSPQTAADEASELLLALKTVDSRLGKLFKQAQSLFEKVRSLASTAEFAKADLELADILRRNTLEEALDDFERVENGIRQREDTLKDDLAKLDEDFDRAVLQASQLVSDALGLLRRATETHKLPDHVPRVAGKTVITMHKSVLTKMAAEGRKYDTGAALATHAIMALANERLGLKILKVVDVADEQYVPVEKLSKSGAEGIAMAILLYFVLARLRSEQRQQTKAAEGGVLILDNPFAKATVRAVWQIIIGLADSMGLQLVIATGIQETEPLSVFRRFLRLAKTHQNSVTGRRHLSLADYTFKPDGAVTT